MKRRNGTEYECRVKQKVLLLASVASMIDQFNMPNIRLLLYMGYEVHVACNFKKGNTCHAQRLRGLQNTLRNMGVVMHQWDCPRKLWPFHDCKKAYRQLRGHISRGGYAWIHCQSPIGGGLARIAAHQEQVFLIYTAHGFHFYKGALLKNWILYYPAEKLLAHWTDVLITISREDYRLAVRKLHAKKIAYIPGVGLDLSRFQKKKSQCQDRADAFRRKYQIPDQAQILLSVGELNRGKNHQIVIKALAALRRQDVYYLICGQGGLAKKLQKEADRLGVGSRVRIPGFQDDMEWIYENADIFVLPSRREGLSVALMEAMAAGLPCVVSDIRGNRELMGAAKGDHMWKPGGICFDLKKTGQLMEALEKLLADKRLCMRCAAANRRRILKYGVRQVQKQMYRIYCYAGAEHVEKPLRRNLEEKAEERKTDAQKIKKHVTVSVLLAVYCPDFTWLQQLFLSIRRQSFQDFEIILMDDGSGQAVFDEVCTAAYKIFGKSERLRLLQSPVNEGSDRTFEKLALLAGGDYIAFCDQDDIWRPDKLQKLLEELHRQKAVMCYSDMQVIDGSGKLLYTGLRQMRPGLRFVSGTGMAAWYVMDNCTAACSMLVQSQIVKKAVPFYEGACCDQWVAIWAASCGKVAFINEPLVKYRRHDKNQTAALKKIETRRDYVRERILPAEGFVKELRARGVSYPYEKEINALVQARKEGDFAVIWKFRRFSRKYAYFDLFAACMPEPIVNWTIRLIKNRAAKGMKTQNSEETEQET